MDEFCGFIFEMAYMVVNIKTSAVNALIKTHTKNSFNMTHFQKIILENNSRLENV